MRPAPVVQAKTPFLKRWPREKREARREPFMRAYHSDQDSPLNAALDHSLSAKKDCPAGWTYERVQVVRDDISGEWHTVIRFYNPKLHKARHQ